LEEESHGRYILYSDVPRRSIANSERLLEIGNPDRFEWRGSRKCGKQRTWERRFLDLWQRKELRAKSRKCGKQKRGGPGGGQEESALEGTHPGRFVSMW